MDSVIAFGSVVLTLLALVMMGLSYLDHVSRRRTAIRALEAIFEQKPPGRLKSGRAVLGGKVRAKKSAKTRPVVSGGAITELLQSGRASAWQQPETRMESKSFDLQLESGEQVRVVLGKGANLRVETDARERDEARRLVAEWEILDGDDVYVEGTLERDPGKAEGYRDHKDRWTIRSGEEPTILRTRGAIRAWRATRLAPQHLLLIALTLTVVCVYGAVDLAMVESSMVTTDGIATVKDVERRGSKGKRYVGQDMTVRFENEQGQTRTCGPIRGDRVQDGSRVGIRYSKTDPDRCLRAGSYGRGDIEILYFVTALVFASGSAALFIIRKTGWIGSRPWFAREAMWPVAASRAVPEREIS